MNTILDELNNSLAITNETLIELNNILEQLNGISLDSISNSINEVNEAIKQLNDDQTSSVTISELLISTLTILATAFAIAKTAAQTFNAAFLTNPVSLTLIAVASLVTAMFNLSSATDVQTEKTLSYAEASKKAAEKHQKLIDEANQTASKSSAEMDYYMSLAKELDNLVDANGQVLDSNKERVNFITSTLSKVTGEEIKLVEDGIQNYSILKETIRGLIEQKKAKAILDAHENDYVDAIQKQEDAYSKLLKKQNELNDCEANRSKIIADYKKEHISTFRTEEELNNAAVASYNAKLQTLKKEVSAQDQEFQKYTSTVDNYERATSDYLEGSYKDISKTLSGTNEIYMDNSNKRKKQIETDISEEIFAINKLNSKKGEMSQEQFKNDKSILEQQYLEKQKHLSEVNEMILQETPAYKNAMEELSKAGIVAYDESGNLTEAAKKKFDELGITVEDSKGQYVSALSELVNEGQSIFDENGNLSIPAQKKLVEVFNGIEEVNPLYGEALTKMVNDGQLVFDENGNLTELAQKKLLDTLLSMEEIDPLYSEALNQMANEGQAIFDLNGELTTAAQKKMLDAFSKMNEDKPKYTEVLTQMANEGQQVFDSNGNLTIPAQKKLIDAYASINNLSPGYKQKLYDMVNEGKDAFDSNGDLTEGAKSKINGAKKGVDDSKYNLKNSMRSASLEGFAEFCATDTFSAGVSFIAGAAQGANANSTSFINTITSIALWGLSTISKLWDINSPSKKTKKLAASFMEGLDIGIEKNKSGFFDQISTMGEDAISELESSFQSINVNALGNRMRMAIENENLHMRGIVNSNFTSELFSSGKLKVELPKISGTIHGSIENHILMDGRETAVQLTPFISEELAFSSK